MYITALLAATPGEHIDDFAEEVVHYSQAIQRNVMAVFNDIYIKVKPTTTEKEFLHEYWRAR